MKAELVLMNLRVSREARDAWAAFAAANGATASALAEAIGQCLVSMECDSLSTVAIMAAAITEERRVRKPGQAGQGSGQEPG